MAWVEAAAVYYLRSLIGRIEPYQPDPLPEAGGFGEAEVVRELATMVMLLAVGWLAGKNARSRLGYAVVSFGIWDIFYYVFLRVIIGWPRSLSNWNRDWNKSCERCVGLLPGSANPRVARRRPGGAQGVGGGPGNGPYARVCRCYFRRRGSVWRGDGLLALASSGRLQPPEIPARHSGDRFRQCAAQRHARAVAWAEPPLSPVAHARVDELHDCGGDPRFVCAHRVLHHLERAVARRPDAGPLGDLQFCPAHTGRYHRLRWNGGQLPVASFAAGVERQRTRRAQSPFLLARWKLVPRQSTLLDSASAHWLARIAGGVSAPQRLSGQLLRNGVSRHKSFAFILNPTQIKTMNDPNPPPPVIRPTIPSGQPTVSSAQPPPGANPEERAPIPNFAAAIEAILRQPRRV